MKITLVTIAMAGLAVGAAIAQFAHGSHPSSETNRSSGRYAAPGKPDVQTDVRGLQCAAPADATHSPLPTVA